MRYILSIESGKDGRNWLSVKDLTTAVDKFIAARGDAPKPRVFALGQTPRGTGSKPPFNSSNRPASQGDAAAPPKAGTGGPSAGPKVGHSPHTPVKSITCYECGKPGHIRAQCPQLGKSGAAVGGPGSSGPRYSAARRVAVVSGDGQRQTSVTETSNIKPQETMRSIGTATNTETVAVYDVKRVSVLSDNESVNSFGDVLNVKSVDEQSVSIDNVAVGRSVTQLSALTYTDVIVERDDGDDMVVRALVDNGAQLPVIKAGLVNDQNPEVMGRIKLQPFAGEAVEADWIRMKIKARSVHGVTRTHTIDCAVVPNLNEQFIITADVMFRLSQDVNEALIACNVMSDNVNDGDKTHDLTAIFTTNGINSDVSLVDVDNGDDDNDITDNESDNVCDDGHDSHTASDGDLCENEASCQQVAKEQREDTTLTGCFKLAKCGKGGFLLIDNLLYRKKTVVGETIFQLVVPFSRRKHVLDLGHDIFGGHMAERKTRERIEFTFYWPTLQSDCHEYVMTCPTCQLKKRRSKSDRVPITPIPRCDRVFDHLFVDCCGPFVSGEGPKPKFNYALVAIDSYSCFPFCVPLKSLHAKNVCEALLDIWQFTGVSSYLSSDLGTNFTSKLTRELEMQMGCSPRFNSPFHPNATGLVERAVGSVKTIVSKLAVDHPCQWHKHVGGTLWALREAVNSTTGLSPWMLVFGRVPTGPLTILKEHWVGTKKLPVSFGKTATEYLRDVHNRLELA